MFEDACAVGYQNNLISIKLSTILDIANQGAKDKESGEMTVSEIKDSYTQVETKRHSRGNQQRSTFQIYQNRTRISSQLKARGHPQQTAWKSHLPCPHHLLSQFLTGGS